MVTSVVFGRKSVDSTGEHKRLALDFLVEEVLEFVLAARHARVLRREHHEHGVDALKRK